MLFMCVMTNFSRHFMAMGVKVTGQSSLRPVTLVFLGNGTVVVFLKHTGTTDCCSDALKMSVKTGASHTGWNSVWARCFPSFHTLEGYSGLGLSQLKYVVLRMAGQFGGWLRVLPVKASIKRYW